MKCKHNKLLFGLLLGAGAGVAVGLLIAPMSGAETRHRLQRKLTQKEAQLENTIREQRHNSAKTSSNLKDTLSKQFNRLKLAFSAGKEAAQARHKSLQEQVL